MPRLTTLAATAQAVSGAAQIGATLAGAPVLRRRYNRWGASKAEVAMALPGDELITHPRLTYTRAITIRVPMAQVWPWLAQIGQGRGGLYSFDALENLVGCDIHSAEEILADHQELAVGDIVSLGAPERYPRLMVHTVTPPTALVLLSVDPATRQPPATPVPAGAAEPAMTWQWHLRRAAGGGTRLVVRSRLTYPPGQSVLWHLTEPITFVMERRMLLGIKRRSEAV